MPRSRPTTRLDLGSITGVPSFGSGNVIVTAPSPRGLTAVVESAEKSTVASTVPFARNVVRSPAMNDGRIDTSSSMSIVCWKRPCAAEYAERLLSSFSSAGEERSTVEVLNGFGKSRTPVTTPAMPRTPTARAPTTTSVTTELTSPRRRPPSATTRTVTSRSDDEFSRYKLGIRVSGVGARRGTHGVPGGFKETTSSGRFLFRNARGQNGQSVELRGGSGARSVASPTREHDCDRNQHGSRRQQVGRRVDRRGRGG